MRPVVEASSFRTYAAISASCAATTSAGSGSSLTRRARRVRRRRHEILDGETACTEDTDSDYAGCARVDVPDTTTCAADVEIVVSERVYADKPNIYLYPEVPTPVRVTLPAWKYITESDPRYPIEGWRALAHHDGTLSTPIGTRDYLFYEMSPGSS